MNFPELGAGKHKRITPISLDSSFVKSLMMNKYVDDSTQIQVMLFYKKRAFVPAWFNKKDRIYPVAHFYTMLQEYELNFQDSSLYSIPRDSLYALMKLDESSFLLNHLAVKQLEVLLTVTFFQYAQKVYAGLNIDVKTLAWFIKRPKYQFDTLLTTLTFDPKTCQDPHHQQYKTLHAYLKLYRVIEMQGGLPLVEFDDVTALTSYLKLTGDFKGVDSAQHINYRLVIAMKRFQRRMGLPPTGKLNSITLKALNIPIAHRIKQLKINLERYRWMPIRIESERVEVNIPEYKLNMYVNNMSVLQSKIVVGKSITPTNIFKNRLTQITINPYWVIPTSIIQNDIVPKAKLDDNYMQDNDMEVFSGSKLMDLTSINWFAYEGNVPFNIRQKPGLQNALGKMIFQFPNHFNIYLHDTPSKSNFEANDRAFSHGCIRVNEPLKLAKLLLRKHPDWQGEKLAQLLLTNNNTEIRLNHQVAIYILYFTSWVDHNGLLHFRNDVYGLDKQLGDVFL
jgi:murein L,D-transpeptidase YcbB/YkuD